MEEYMSKAVELLSSADVYMVAIAAVLTALLPIIRKTKNKTDDKVADTTLSLIAKAKAFLVGRKKK